MSPGGRRGSKDKRNAGSLLTRLYQRELDSVNTLYAKGARLLRLTDENRPAESRGFYDRQLSLDALLAHLDNGHRLARIHRRTPLDGVRAAEGGG